MVLGSVERISAMRTGVTFVALACVGFLAACGGPGKSTSAPPPKNGVIVDQTPSGSGIESGTLETLNLDDGPRSSPVPVAILLPLSAENEGVRQIANHLLRAAQLAESDFDQPRMLLSVGDTYGTPEGATNAARQAVANGAEIILGPLFATSVAAVKPVAAEFGVNVIAFSSDSSVAGDNAFLLSFLPEQEVDRVVEFAIERGFREFGSLTPTGGYGERVAAAFSRSVSQRGGTITSSAEFPQDPTEMLEPVRQFAEYRERQSALEREIERREAAGDRATVSQLEMLDTFGDVSFKAAMVPGNPLVMQSIAPLFPYFDIDLSKVQLLGTGIWNDPNVFREPLLKRAWFAAPSLAVRQDFVDRYIQAYRDRPPLIASLAYDAVALSATLVSTELHEPFALEVLTDPDGFSGVDGPFRFRPSGLSERGLAVLQIDDGEFFEVSPAPQVLGPPVF